MKNRVFGIYGRVFENWVMHTGYVIDTPHFSFSHNIRGDSFFVLLGGIILGRAKKILGGWVVYKK
jgi:hypothetical protein